MSEPGPVPVREKNDGDYSTTPPGFFKRYKGFLLAKGTLITYANAILMIAGFVVELSGNQGLANILFLFSAIIGGWPIFVLAAGNIIKRFDLTAGVMVSIAMIAAMIVGEYSAAALVAFMMLVGEMLEDFTVARADNALVELQSLVPDIVTLRRDKADVDVSISSVGPGDRVLVRPGARVPVDGLVSDGSAAIDQSSISGESMPVDKAVGDRVYAGTLCVSGTVTVTVEQIGQETTLGNMIRLVREARSTQAPVHRIANKYAQYLTPMAITIAIITYLITRDVTRSITVLIVICPCSLVLATPTALVAAIGNAAKRGVLVKHGPAMEQIGKVDVIAFDKTGTLTLGEPHLEQVIPLGGLDQTTLLTLAASAERSSEHPLARAVVSAAQAQGLVVPIPETFQMAAGQGVTATVDKRQVVIGQGLVAEMGIRVPSDAAARTGQFEASGKTVVPLAVDGALEGLLTLSDTIRDESRQAIADLKAWGIGETVLISGDSQAVAQSVGEALGVDRIEAEIMPEGKLAFIRDLQEQGRAVAFVGDGVNDAPALAAADVGIAMGSIGTAVAVETADIVLLSDRLERLPYLVELSRQSLKTIRNNVIFAMSMNVLSVILGVSGVIGPVFGAVMHEASALPVVANAARLIGYKPKGGHS